MAPDDDQKNDDPTRKRPGHKDVLDGDYAVIASEDISEEDDEDGDDDSGDGKKSGDRTTLALDVPDPEAALAAAEGPAAKEGKVKPGERKGKKDAAKSGDAKTPGVTVDEKAFGVEESASAETPAQDAAQQDLSAFDRDEITDPEGDSIDPLQMLLGEVEKPWENEKLSAAEQKALNQVYKQNDPAEAEAREADETDPKAKGRKSSGLQNVAAAAVVAAAATALAARKAAAETKARPESKSPAPAGISRGPRREAEQDQAQIKTEAARPAPIAAATTTESPASTNASIAAVLGVGMATGANLNSSSTLQQYEGKYNPNTNADPASLQLFQQVITENSMQPEFQMQPLAWTPDHPDANFLESLNTVYDGMNENTLTDVTLYRQSGWDDKRLEQKENSMDVTIAPAPKPEPAPAPEPAYNRDLQMNIGPGGP